MIVRVSELAKISEKLIEHLRDVTGETIDISVDYYWHIPKAEKYDQYEQPSQLNIGQISDDWNELQKLLYDDTKPLSHYLIWLAAVERAIGEQIIP